MMLSALAIAILTTTFTYDLPPTAIPAHVEITVPGEDPTIGELIYVVMDKTMWMEGTAFENNFAIMGTIGPEGGLGGADVSIGGEFRVGSLIHRDTTPGKYPAFSLAMFDTPEVPLTFMAHFLTWEGHTDADIGVGTLTAHLFFTYYYLVPGEPKSVPEPGIALGLGLGLIALVRRKGWGPRPR